jgi:serine/threonine-protein kinase RsbW
MSARAEMRVDAELRLPARSSELVAARAYAASVAAAFGMDAESGHDFVYAANEAVTNAIRHGTPAEDGEIVLSTVATDDRLTFSVRDFGAFTMPTWPLQERVEAGRGFALMVRLVDDVKLSIHPDGTTVTLVKMRV